MKIVQDVAKISTNKKLFPDAAEFKKNIMRDKALYVMLVLPLVWFVIFHYIPMFGLQIAFKDYSLFKGMAASPWVGLKHFTDFLTGPYFWRTFRNTVLINIYSLIFSFPLPILLAILYNEMRSKKFVRISQTLVYMPHFISSVVVAGMVINFLSPSSGIVNKIIQHFGGEAVFFMAKPEYFRTIFISQGIWHSVGFSSIIYIAALSAVDVQLYEAAIIDGAGRFRQVWNVALPTILPTIMINLILRIGHLLSLGYETIILLYQPATYETADVISSYIYRTGLNDGNYSFATAIGLFNSIIALVLVAVTNYASKKAVDVGIW